MFLYYSVFKKIIANTFRREKFDSFKRAAFRRWQLLFYYCNFISRVLFL